jgi:hypothetical protein
LATRPRRNCEDPGRIKPGADSLPAAKPLSFASGTLRPNRAVDFLKGEMMPKLKYVIVRTYSAGVFAGNLKSHKGQEVVLTNARRLWYWRGAASLSQLAVDGTSQPNSCKFPCEVPLIELMQAIEILDVTPKAQKSIKEVPVWKV